MTIPAFDPKELEVISENPESPRMPAVKVFNYPVSEKEAVQAAMSRKPVWQIIGIERRTFTPRIIPDNVARAFVLEAVPFDPNKGGGKDMFGMEWEYVQSAGGSMIRPGKPFMDDAGEWYNKVIWPDIESWDWEGSAKENNGIFLKPDKYNLAWFQTGWFERLITFLDFENAVIALIDDEQKDAVKDFFDRLSDLYIKIFKKYITYFPEVDGFYIHDDWGSQKETFFSPDAAEEMIVPYMRRVTDYLHSRGKFCELHSCGQIFKQIPNIIAAGWDAWGGQMMNDTHKIYELYGDKLLVGVMPDIIDPASVTEEKLREAARDYANKFCRPDKPSFFNHYAGTMLVPAFREELYKQSRINYSS